MTDIKVHPEGMLRRNKELLLNHIGKGGEYEYEHGSLQVYNND